MKKIARKDSKQDISSQKILKAIIVRLHFIELYTFVPTLQLRFK